MNYQRVYIYRGRWQGFSASILSTTNDRKNVYLNIDVLDASKWLIRSVPITHIRPEASITVGEHVTILDPIFGQYIGIVQHIQGTLCITNQRSFPLKYIRRIPNRGLLSNKQITKIERWSSKFFISLFFYYFIIFFVISLFGFINVDRTYVNLSRKIFYGEHYQWT